LFGKEAKEATHF